MRHKRPTNHLSKVLDWTEHVERTTYEYEHNGSTETKGEKDRWRIATFPTPEDFDFRSPWQAGGSVNIIP